MSSPAASPSATPLREVIGHGTDAVCPPLIDAIRMLGWSRFARTQVHGLRPHAHACYEFCYIADGGVHWRIGERAVDVGRGELFFTHPHERHGGDDEMMHPCELYWIQVHLPPTLPFLDWNAATLAHCHASLAGCGPRRLPGSPEIALLFGALMREHRSPDALSPAAVSGQLSQLLIRMVRAMDQWSARRDDTPQPSPLIATAIEWMLQRLGEPFLIQDAAAAIGLHPARFHERFLAETGQAPSDWRMRQRIMAAQQRLSHPDASITAVAFDLGFASSQYFATAFKKYTGHTPSAFRRRLRGKPAAPGPALDSPEGVW